MAREIPAKNVRAVLRGAYGSPYEFETDAIGNVPNGSALIRINYAGLCHGDVYTRNGGGPAPAKPLRPLTGGHEGIGEIVEKNDIDGRYPNFPVGLTVGIAWRNSVCGECDACIGDAENFCAYQLVNGMQTDGTFQEYIVHPLNQLIPIPSGLSQDIACPILCAGVTSYSALKAMQPVAGKWVVIAGAAGATGHLAIQFAKNVFGLNVVAIDGGETARQELCLSLGSDHYVDYIEAGEDLAGEIISKTHGGADYAVIFSPSQQAYQYAGEYMRFRGKIMAVGIGNCSMPLRPLLKKQLQITSNQTGSKAEIFEALLHCQAGKVVCKVKILEFRELDDGLSLLAKGDRVLGKLLVRIDNR